MFGFPFITSATTEAIDFKFGVQLRFAMAHHKIPPGRKGGHWARELQKLWGSPLLFLQQYNTVFVYYELTERSSTQEA